jgi:hypothetical protein
MGDGKNSAEEIDLLTKKVRLEILRTRLKSDEERLTRGKEKLPISTAIKNWTAVALGIIAAASAAWGVFGPIATYVDVKRRQLTFELNDNMIKFVDSLRSGEDLAKNDALLMLMYYEQNALPIFYHKLESCRYERDKADFNLLTDAINRIYILNDRRVVKGILKRCDALYANLFSYKDDKSDVDLNTMKYNAIISYTYLLGSLDLNSKDRKETRNYLTGMQSRIKNESESRKNHLVAYELGVEKVLKGFTATSKKKSKRQRLNSSTGP